MGEKAAEPSNPRDEPAAAGELPKALLDVVTCHQRRLNEDGADLVVDGILGPKTEAAVKAFQRRTGGLKVDGIVGAATAAALRLNGARAA